MIYELLIFLKKFFTILILFLSASIFSQNTYLHCGKIIDTKNGKVLNNKTIIVSSIQMTLLNGK